MSASNEIQRLTDARDTIRDKIVSFGLAVSTAKLDDLADAIDSITNRGAITATVQDGSTYTIPEGYHNGSGTVSGVPSYQIATDQEVSAMLTRVFG